MIKDYVFCEEDKRPVVIYGASIGGMIVFQCLKKLGIEVAYFCDRKKAGQIFCDQEVKEPAVLTNESLKVIIAVNRSFKSVYSFLKSIDYKEIYSCETLIRDKKVTDFVINENDVLMVEEFLKTYTYTVKKEKNIYDGKIILPVLEVFITERCTLKCKDCGQLIPYYKNPQDHDVNKIINDLENVCKVVESISELFILGGEPLLHPDIGKVLQWGHAQEKVGKIVIITNGCVMPSDEILAIIKECNVVLRISDYGRYSYKLKEILQVCEKKEIEYYILHELWTDMGRVYNRNYTQEELREVFSDCPFAQVLLLLRGRIWRCAHVAQMNNLKLLESEGHDSVDFEFLEENALQEKRKELIQYMKVNYLIGCAYCNGTKNSIQGIEPAIQCQ